VKIELLTFEGCPNAQSARELVERVVAESRVEAEIAYVDVPDPDLGVVTMSAPTPRLSETPGAIRWAGPALGAHNREVYAGELGLSDAEMERFRQAGVI